MKTAIKYHGGKSYLAKYIVSLFPKHKRYVEPYFGGGSVFFEKEPVGAEFVNDLNRELIDFWCVLRDTPSRMLHKLWATPLSQVMFEEAASNLTNDDRLQRATAFFIRNRQSRQGLGKDYCTPTKRLRRGMNENVSAWLSAIDGLPELHRRLQRVEIRCQDALRFIRDLDSVDTLFYLDPPYLHETRSSVGEYGGLEMSVADHLSLLRLLKTISGKFILSGYRSESYDSACAENGWNRLDIETPNHASSKSKKDIKTECLWMNY